jgi:hypothetical protein
MVTVLVSSRSPGMVIGSELAGEEIGGGSVAD